MKSTASTVCCKGALLLYLMVAVALSSISKAQEGSKESPVSAQAVPAGVLTFDTPQKAAAVLIEAADKFDVPELTHIFGHDVEDVIFSGEFAQDRKHAADFAAEARESNSVSVDPRTNTRAFLLVGKEEWPFPVPIVKSGTKWFFDTPAGRQELLYRRIGANELDAIEICHGYVEAQHGSHFLSKNRVSRHRR